ncbi:MAG: hypothetical protein ACFFDT_10570 [Candidatus Hodarchaeota archaeon]
MKLSTEQIIERIQQQTSLSKNQVLIRIDHLRKSLKYGERGVIDEDILIPKLLAQELDVDLGDPTDHLYIELIFEQWPLFVRLIPLSTIDKEKIIIILRKLVNELEDQIREFLNVGVKDRREDLVFSERMFQILDYWANPKNSQFFAKEGVLFNIEFGSNEEHGEFTLEYIVDQAEVYHTFTDYKIIRSTNPLKTYLPYSLVDNTFYHPPAWAAFHEENRENWLKFSYITLASLEMTPQLEDINIEYTCTEEI